MIFNKKLITCEKGFSFIEVMLSMAILIGSLTASSYLISDQFKWGKRQSASVVAKSIESALVEEISEQVEDFPAFFEENSNISNVYIRCYDKDGIIKGFIEEENGPFERSDFDWLLVQLPEDQNDVRFNTVSYATDHCSGDQAKGMLYGHEVHFFWERLNDGRIVSRLYTITLMPSNGQIRNDNEEMSARNGNRRSVASIGLEL